MENNEERDLAALLHLETNLVAACMLLRLDIEAIRERSGIYEYDAFMTRNRATRLAFSEYMKIADSGFPKCLSDWLLDNAAQLFDAELRGGRSREDTCRAVAEALGVVEIEAVTCA
jgi:hypothetical protein